MVGLKCIQDTLTMAEPHNSMQNVGKKDILSAALGQSGLSFTESVQDDVEDVFAALAEDADYSSYVPKSKQHPSRTENVKREVKTGQFDPNESYENDLDDLMDLISSDMNALPGQQVQESRPVVAFPRSMVANTTDISSFGDIKFDAISQPDSNFLFSPSLNMLKLNAPIVCPPKPNFSIDSEKMPGLKSIIADKRYFDSFKL